MHLYLVCFDISDDPVRTKVGKHLLRHGNRVQKSVFEVALRGQEQLEVLREELVTIVGEETNIRFYHLCANCRKDSSVLTGGPVAELPAVVII